MSRSTAAAFAAVAIAAAGAVQGQDKPVNLRFSYWVPPVHQLIPSTKEWGESLTRASNGSIKVTIYPSNQLGKGPDHYDMAKDGIADFVLTNPGYTPGRFPVIAAAELPFLTNGAANGSPGFDEWYRKYQNREMKEVYTCLTFTHEPGTWHTRAKKVELPEDVKGLKVRTGNATSSRFVSMLGGSPVAVEITEARETIARGIADGILVPWEAITMFRMTDALKYHMENPFYVSIFTWNLNRKTYDSMSAAQKKVLDDHCTTAWAQKIAAAWAQRDVDAIAKVKAMKDARTIYSINPTQLAAWRKAAEPLKKEWEDSVTKAGYNATEVYNELIAALRKHNGLYQ